MAEFGQQERKAVKPDLFTREQVAEIVEKTKLTSEAQDFETRSGETKISLSLRTNDVVLLTIE